MVDIKEVVDSVKGVLLDPLKEEVKFRARNNFFGTLVVSWLFWNWESIAYFIFSTDPILIKILTVKNLFPLEQDKQTPGFLHSHVLLMPLITATAFVLFYPGFMFLLAKCHEWILRKIDILNESKELLRLKRIEGLIEQSESNEGIKARKKAEYERQIAEDTEAAVKARLNVSDIAKKYAEIETDIKTKTLERDGLEVSIKNLQQRKDELSDDLIVVNSQYAPIKSENDKYQKILKDNSELNAELDKLRRKCSGLEEDMRDYKREAETQIMNLTATLGNVKRGDVKPSDL